MHAGGFISYDYDLVEGPNRIDFDTRLETEAGAGGIWMYFDNRFTTFDISVTDLRIELYNVALLYQDAVASGSTYKMTFDVSNWTGGDGGTGNSVMNTDGTEYYRITYNGYHDIEFTHTSPDPSLFFRSRNTGSMDIDNVSVREVF